MRPWQSVLPATQNGGVWSPRPYGWKQELRRERDDAHIVLYEIIGHPRPRLNSI